MEIHTLYISPYIAKYFEGKQPQAQSTSTSGSETGLSPTLVDLTRVNKHPTSSLLSFSLLVHADIVTRLAKVCILFISQLIKRSDSLQLNADWKELRETCKVFLVLVLCLVRCQKLVQIKLNHELDERAEESLVSTEEEPET